MTVAICILRTHYAGAAAGWIELSCSSKAAAAAAAARYRGCFCCCCWLPKQSLRLRLRTSEREKKTWKLLFWVKSENQDNSIQLIFLLLFMIYNNHRIPSFLLHWSLSLLLITNNWQYYIQLYLFIGGQVGEIRWFKHRVELYMCLINIFVS